jgi:hypothetical protein
MAKVIIGHHPELAAEDAMKIFQSHFAGKYEIYRRGMGRSAIHVKQSAWRGVDARLRQKRGKTYFETGAYAALAIAAGICVVLLGVAAIFLSVYQLRGAGLVTQVTAAIVLLVLFSWLASLVASRPSRKLENEVKAFIANAEEFK